MKRKGYWFYGLSGSGKSFAAKFINKKIKKSIILDGDYIRKVVSFDLDYKIKDREIQIKRVLGIAKIAQLSKFIPIISTVYMNKKILSEAKKSGIKVILVERDLTNIFTTHPTYKNKKNVVGKDIKLKNLKTRKIFNISKSQFSKELLSLIR